MTRREVPRKIFLEESPEFIPQKASYQLGRECAEIVERLVTLGGNYGYGATLIGQRPAEISKTALSQCETVFVFATQGSHDRKALEAWIRSRNAALDPKTLDGLADLKSGTAWCWSPRFLRMFEKILVRPRSTFHPRDARRLGVSVREVELAPVDEFVAKVRRQLTKTQAVVPGAPTKASSSRSEQSMAASDQAVEISELQTAKANLEGQLAKALGEIDAERRRRRAIEKRLEVVRRHLKPQYEMLEALFRDLGEEEPGNGSIVDRTAYEPWLLKAGRQGCRRVLEVLLDKPELTRHQLGILSGTPPEKSTFRAYMAWLKRAGLVEVEGETVRLKAI